MTRKVAPSLVRPPAVGVNHIAAWHSSDVPPGRYQRWLVDRHSRSVRCVGRPRRASAGATSFGAGRRRFRYLHSLRRMCEVPENVRPFPSAQHGMDRVFRKESKPCSGKPPLAATLNSKGYFREWQTRTIGFGLVAQPERLIMGEYRGDGLADTQNQEAKPISIKSAKILHG